MLNVTHLIIYWYYKFTDFVSNTDITDIVILIIVLLIVPIYWYE